MNEPARTRALFWRALPWALLALLLVAIGWAHAWPQRYRLYSDQALWRAARASSGDRAVRLYALLEARMPELGDYWLLWSAQTRLPAPQAVADLYTVTRSRPDSPAAFEAHVALARHYASIESPQTVNAYLDALKLEERADVRLELARYLEEQRATAGAYRQYLALLGPGRIDAFVGMRRTAPDVLTLANDLLSRVYCSDVLDVLGALEGCEADCLRAEALGCLGRASEAEVYQGACDACKAEASDDGAAEDEPPPPEDVAPEETLPPDAARQEAEPPEPDPLASPDPLDWWSHTWTLEEEGRLQEAKDVYLRIAATASYVADDAAYRAWVLARREDDPEAQERALALLQAMQPNWLAYRATGTLGWQPAPDFPQQALDDLAGDTLAIVEGLERLGERELALAELRFAGRVSEIPEVILAMARGLAERGEVRSAWSLAVAELLREPRSVTGFWRLAYPRVHEQEVLSATGREGVDPALLWAIMRQESAFDPDAVSHAGARGLMQFMPATQQDMAVAAGRAYAPGDAFQPAVAIDLGARYLGLLAEMYPDRPDLVVMAYNAGPAAVNQWLADPLIQDEDDMLRFAWYGETREYLTRVMLDRVLYQEIWGPGQ